MNVTNKNEKKTKRTKAEFRLYMKERSKVYYSTPEMLEKQRLKCIEYRSTTVDKRNARRRVLSKRVRLEKNLKRIWITKGMLK